MHDRRTRSSLLLLRQPELPTAQALLSQAAKRFPNAPTLLAAHEGSTSCTLESSAASFHIQLIPAPLPWSELEGPCETSWHWPQATRKSKAHTAHLVVTASSTALDVKDLMLALTRVVAATALATPSLGIYWRGATQVHDVKGFVDEASQATREQLPLYLWLRFGLSREHDGSTSLYTTGLADLEHMELEIPHSALDPQTLVDRAFNISHYLMDRGAVLEDGHTIGISAEEKFEIRYLPSMWDAQRRVYSLRSHSQ